MKITGTGYGSTAEILKKTIGNKKTACGVYSRIWVARSHGYLVEWSSTREKVKKSD